MDESHEVNQVVGNVTAQTNAVNPLGQNLGPETRGRNSFLDLDREASFQRLSGSLKKMSDQDVKTWLINVFNPILTQDGGKPLGVGDVSSVHCVDVTSKSTSDFAGQEVVRPVLFFYDFEQFAKLYFRIFPQSPNAGAAVVAGFVGGDLEKTGLIMSPLNETRVVHEIRHTIDPNMTKREGKDRALEEVFAYYFDTIIAGSNYGGTADHLWANLENFVNTDHYYLTYSSNGTDFSKEDYKKTCHGLVAKARELKEKYGDIIVQRMIARSRTIHEFMGLY